MPPRVARSIGSLALLLACNAPGCVDRKADSQPTLRDPVGTPSASATGASGPTCRDGAKAAVRVIDDTHCEVSKGAFFGDDDCLLARPNLAPVSMGGQVVGFRHDAIGPSSVYGLCGIRSGDVWVKVNGHSLATPDDALNVYPKLREADALAIELLREGRPLHIDIALR